MRNIYNHRRMPLDTTDYGPEPFVFDIDNATEQNNNYRKALWTGEYLQLTLMSIKVGGDIGLEMHPRLINLFELKRAVDLLRWAAIKTN